ncbi:MULTISPECIES: MBL fold metallo-hydrolase [Pseudoalteromonas]|uniref:MBL fold metallo-hydrolase n=1 Tax=Pseudoalteromonas TaxID=53246 RepID=UPI000308AE28|nr:MULTISPECIES: MBL fold metallo-hydrolase [Pseudoalteromonas]MDP4489531.1 MBL fold metallo-hydrolase [Pseudoalteromonas piscicida]
MISEKLYLKSEVYFEPLMNHWYAWPYLIPPVTAARHVVNTHRRIMQSFVKNYKLHILASKESVLTGGEFLNCTEDQVSDIQALIEEQNERCGDLIELSDAVKHLDELLYSHTSGESIEYIYAKIPEPLRGCIELFLDMEHRPSYRIIEPLMYRSAYYKPTLQSLSFGLLSKVDERPFVFSTPRLPDNNHLQVKADFNDQIVDALFQAREIPLTSEQIEALFEGYELDGGVSYRELFTTEKPTINHMPVKEGVRLNYTGHAGFLIETADVCILVDPVIASRNTNDDDTMISFSELPQKIDYILLTHTHMDHANIETLLQLRYKTNTVVVPKNNGGTLPDPSLRLILKQLNFNVIEVDDLDEIEIPAGRIVALPFLGEHGDLNIRTKAAWYIEVLGKKCFFGADCANPDGQLFEKLGAIFTDIDVLAIGMECVGAPYTWSYGALHTKKVPKSIKNSRRLDGADCDQALPMVKAFNAKQVYVYAIGLETCFKYFMGLEHEEDSRQIAESTKFLASCEEIGVPADIISGKKTIHLK